MPYMDIRISIWDFVLFVAVVLMGAGVAYLHHPRLKAFVLMLPIPFSVANLSLGIRVNATHALGLIVLYVFWHTVRFYQTVRLTGRFALPVGSNVMTGYDWGGRGSRRAGLEEDRDLDIW
jgi:hypothetical protein